MGHDGLNEKMKKHLRAIELALNSIIKSKKIPPLKKDLGYLCLTYEYFMIDMEDEGWELLRKISSDYWDNQLKKDINNKDVAIIVIRMAKKVDDIQRTEQ